MIHPIRAWNAFFFRPVSARPLGVMRIAFGLVALANLAFSAVELDHWYSDVGLLQGSEARVIAGPLQLSPLLWYQDPITVRAVFGVTAAFGFLLTIGLWTRVASVLFYLGMLSIQFRNLVSSSGADVLVMTFAFNLMFCPSGAAYSVDAWFRSRRRGGTVAEAIILPWGMRLIQIQISLVYAVAVILKVNGGMWMNGTALHYVLNNTEVRRLDFSFLTQYPVLINIMTYSALVMEFSLAVFLWYQPARRFVMLMGLMLHGGIMMTINIPIFGELMWVGYLAFLTPTELDALLKPFNVVGWFRKPAEATPAAFPTTMTVRIDGPAAAVPTPHFVEPEPEPELDYVRPYEESAESYAEAAREEAELYGSFQIYL